MKRLQAAFVALALGLPAMPASAGEAVNLILNWTPTADHSPFYYAKAQGWYEKAGIDLTIEVGKGSAVSAPRSAPAARRSASPISPPCWSPRARAPTMSR